MTKEIFQNCELDKEEQWYDEHYDEFKPCDNQEDMRKQAIEAAKSLISEKRIKKPVTINIDNRAIDYFKELADETGTPYQNLINMYLVQCANERKKIRFI